MNKFLILKEFVNLFFGILLFLYVGLDVYFSGSLPIYAHYFGIALFSAAFIKNIFLNEAKFFVNRSVFLYLLFVSWAVISIFWAINQDFYYERFQRIIFCAMVVFFFYNIMKWFDVKTYYLWGVVFAGILNVFVFLEILPNPMSGIITDEITFRFSGTTGNANTGAMVMSFSIFASILLFHFLLYREHKYLRWLLLANIPASIYIIVQSGSRKGVITGLSFLFLFIVPYIKGTRALLSGAFMVLVLALSFMYMLESEDFAEQVDFVLNRFEKAQGTIEGIEMEESTLHRLSLIDMGVDLWKKNPIIGVGLNNFSYFSGGFYAHNNFVEILVNFGVVGFILYVLFLFFCLLEAFKIKDKTLKIQCVIFLLIIFASDYASVSYYFIPYLMMLIFISSLSKTININDKEND